jgi:hypothetical protein
MLARGTCNNCRRDYRSVPKLDVGVYQNSQGRWCSKCSGCGKEQAYTRKDHAKQSTLCDWQCKVCRASSKSYSANSAVGNKRRVYNKFKKAAADRRLEWSLSLEEMFASFTGRCALTGWEISIEYANTTASLDRIDNALGYTPHNIQWVHSMVNMCRNKYDLQHFMAMCAAIAQNSRYTRPSPAS